MISFIYYASVCGIQIPIIQYKHAAADGTDIRAAPMEIFAVLLIIIIVVF